MRIGRVLSAIVAPLVLAAALASCSGNHSASSSTTTSASTTTAASAGNELTVLVTNDDGVGAPGIDAIVQALRAVPRTKVIVAAPAQNQSGSGGRTTPGGAPASPATTASGYQATAVAGYPADAVDWALDGGIGVTPDLVLSGINNGQNIGKLVEISGTVGAARAAGAKGVPALAVSQGIGSPPDFPSAAGLALDWVASHRAELLSGALARSKPAEVQNLNVPTCTEGKVKGVLDVPVDTTTEVRIDPVNCATALTGPPPANDVAAFDAGYAPLSILTVPATTGG